ARQIAERLPAGVKWAYTTIKTMLTRLVEKNALTESKRGNTSLYEPLVSKQNARLNAIKSLADQAFDGAFGPLMHFLLEEEKLSAKQRKELMSILKNSTKEKGDRK
ncbi:MAG: BlaI/MecI/CopY family transcriptional regulator, partial [Planctomycetota bacterium]